uniref:Uncharacterized protein n=1 Tax=Romanomermis culicivorax TaxID=13658 RepID=A0A915JW88_ROMCU
MTLKTYVVLIKDGYDGKLMGKFTYIADPSKKPYIDSVLEDFKSMKQIRSIKNWRVITLGGNDVRFLTDYKDRVLVVIPRD